MYNALFDKNKGKILDINGKTIGTMKFKLTNDEIERLAFEYVVLVQSRVVEGIKHFSGGSLGFEKFFLKNIYKPENVEEIEKILIGEQGVSKTLVAKLLNVVEYCNYDKNLLQACDAFIKKYNKGKLPREGTEAAKALPIWEQQIQQYTYFGSLVKPLFDIDMKISELRNSSINNEYEMLLADLSDDVSDSNVSLNNSNFTIDF